ncbi:hypothetical protein DSO57_1036082 [Entomophthora muscae]|uniref:Uncharacterized protein n=2 Tax=Entomophthora muscae TaxID=34485 RepID=A0ACC2SCR6_9FUNG|nr:hypothetical protein DSO57_1016714 [Entomophthora muscae]KAJ9059957.1 hypothetical protein DSO57_1036082 [Entomophthora muscae]
MKSASLITLGVVAAIPLHEQPSQLDIVKATDQDISYSQAASRGENADSFSDGDIGQVMTALQNKKLKRRSKNICNAPESNIHCRTT